MVGSLTVNAACDKARRWLDLISKEIDPKTEEERLRAESEAPPGRDLRAGRQRFSRSACRQVRQGERGSVNHRDRASCRDGGIDQSKISCRRCLAGDPVHPCPRLPRLRPAAPLQICATCSTGRLRRMNTRLLSRRSATSNRGGLIGARGASAHLDQRQVAGGVERRRCDGLSVRGRFQVADPDRIGQGSGCRTVVVRKSISARPNGG